MSSRLLSRLIALCAVAGVGLSLALVPSAQAQPGACGRASGCTAFELQHAGSTYGWYPTASRYEFKGGVPSAFKKSGKGGYKTHSGMLLLKATRNAGLSTTWTLSKRTGRWETRFKVSKMRSAVESAEAYTLKIGLIPPRSSAHCGGQGITMLKYHPSQSRTAGMEVNTLPANQFVKSVKSGRSIGQDQWHTVAVEVGKNRISFYLDARVVAKETRPAALLDVPLRMRFALIPVAGKPMRDTVLSLDWARYWTMKKVGKHQDQVRRAPLMKLQPNPKAC
ncbi:hypothetical protein [Marmoricola sp. RAF53]|uniref:hypothetical protein n=1 Tax=Marmoricola sp. RAF53 TaxID=3233059 RepID=UPI003F9C3F7A